MPNNERTTEYAVSNNELRERFKKALRVPIDIYQKPEGKRIIVWKFGGFIMNAEIGPQDTMQAIIEKIDFAGIQTQRRAKQAAQEPKIE